MQYLIKEPDALGSGHAVVQVHQDLDGLEEEHVVELRRDQLPAFVQGCEPGGHQLEGLAHGEGVERMRLFEDNGDEDVEQLLVAEHGACRVFEGLGVEGDIAFFELEEQGFQDLLITWNIHPLHIVADKGVLDIDNPLFDNEEKGDTSFLDS